MSSETDSEDDWAEAVREAFKPQSEIATGKISSISPDQLSDWIPARDKTDYLAYISLLTIEWGFSAEHIRNWIISYMSPVEGDFKAPPTTSPNGHNLDMVKFDLAIGRISNILLASNLDVEEGLNLLRGNLNQRDYKYSEPNSNNSTPFLNRPSRQDDWFALTVSMMSS